jgi:hypothetical protein
MLFLIEYERVRGEIVSLQRFSDADRRQAEDVRLGLEIDLSRRGVEREVVLLEAASEEALRRTHGRYFESLGELVAAASGR